MDEKMIAIAIHLLAAVLAGGVIGLERSSHGRPAGFRTHTLVCLASSLLMLATRYQQEWLPDLPLEAIRADPARMAQGILTGIGFLGAGVIFKEGLNVRGLTTAASIWITSAIGMLIGVGFYFPAILTTVLTLGILTVFRWIENKLPSHTYSQHTLRFDRDNAMQEDEVRGMLKSHGFDIANMSYRITDDGTSFEYRMSMRTLDVQNMSRLADHLRKLGNVRAFGLSPMGD